MSLFIFVFMLFAEKDTGGLQIATIIFIIIIIIIILI